MPTENRLFTHTATALLNANREQVVNTHTATSMPSAHTDQVVNTHTATALLNAHREQTVNRHSNNTVKRSGQQKCSLLTHIVLTHFTFRVTDLTKWTQHIHTHSDSMFCVQYD